MYNMISRRSIYLNMLKRLFLIVLLATTAQAEPGVSPYFCQSKYWKTNEMVSSYSKAGDFFAASIAETSGSNLDCLNKLVSIPNLKVFELHLVNEVCMRNKNCGEYEPFYAAYGQIDPKNYDARIKRKDKDLLAKYRSILAKYYPVYEKTISSGKSFVASIGLESNISIQSAQILIEEVRKYYPKAQISWNPIDKNQRRISGTLHEQHVRKRLDAPCIYNNDGDHFYSKKFGWSDRVIDDAASTLAQYRHCHAAIWGLPDNCRDEGSFVDPRKRKNCATRKDLDAEVQIVNKSRSIGSCPWDWKANTEDKKVCKKVLNPYDGDKRGFLLKQSYDYPGAVAILPTSMSNAQELEVWSTQKVWRKVKRSGTYTEEGGYKGGAIFRFAERTFQFPCGVMIREPKSGTCFEVINPRVRVD